MPSAPHLPPRLAANDGAVSVVAELGRPFAVHYAERRNVRRIAGTPEPAVVTQVSLAELRRHWRR